MTAVFPVTRSVTPVLRSLDLDPETYQGAHEVVDTLFRLHFEPARMGMSQADFQAATANAIDYWRFQLDAARYYAGPFFGPNAALGDSVVCSLIGGIDLVCDARIRPWKTGAARESCRILGDAARVHSARDLYYAQMDTRFYVMMEVYCDLCTQKALLDANPDHHAAMPGPSSPVGRAKQLDFPHCQLTLDIRAAERQLLDAWRKTGKNPEPANRLHMH